MRAIGSVILCYHRVLPQLRSTTPGVRSHLDMKVEAERFRKHMEVLARHFAVVPLSELLRRLASGSLQTGLAAVTFDDGYVDNYRHAFPVLRQLGLPATIFLCTNNIELQTAYWWDRLAWIVYRSRGSVLHTPPELGGPVDLRIDGSGRRAYAALARRLLVMKDTGARDRSLEAMAAGMPREPEGDRPMTWQEAAEMLRHGISFGAHSCSHPALDVLPDAPLQAEITGSLDLIAGRLGVIPDAFAYPHGRADARVTGAVASSGFLGAVTVSEGLCFCSTYRYLLPRLQVHNWSQPFFAKYLHMLSRGAAVAEPSSALKAAVKFAVPTPLLAASRLFRRTSGRSKP